MAPALTAAQVQIIKDSWEVPKKNPTDSGEAILLRFFEKYPHNQQKFHSFKNIPLSSLKGSAGFRSHANRIMVVFQNAMDAFDSDDVMGTLVNLWTPVAESHAKRHITKESFNELKDVILEVMTAVCSLNEEQQQAWVVLFENVYTIVFPILGDK